MDCNKEEAVRAKGIAELKLESKDFVAARKFALKAQQLYSDLDNILQLLSVCDVHCSAQNKMLGNEKDWYSILQLDQAADEALIKKQYRKLALLLHPDKNKLSGAEAAFKLIGEAQSVLLDKEKRAFHDMKRRTFKPVVHTQPRQQANANANMGRQPKVNNYTGSAGAKMSGANSASHPNPPQVHSGVPNGRETFWTQCPFCAVRYQYYKEVLNRALRCQSCKKPFIAYDMCAQGVHAGTNVSQHPYVKQDATYQDTGRSVGSDGFHDQQNKTKECFPNARQHAEVGPQKTRDLHRATPENDKVGGLGGSKLHRKVYGKRGQKQVKESSERLDSSSTDLKEGLGINEDGPQKTSDLHRGTSEDDKAAGLGGSRLYKKLYGKRGKKQVEESSESLDSSSTDLEEGIGINEDGPQKTSDLHRGTPEDDKTGGLGGSKLYRKVYDKIVKKQIEESSESLDSSSTDLKEGIGINEDGHVMSNGIKVDAESQPRRSSRSKRHVSYDEGVSDEDEVLNPLKRSRTSPDENLEDTKLKEKPSNLEKSYNQGGRAESLREKEKVENDIEADQASTSNSSSKGAPEPEIHAVPDPDFHDFDDGRKEECFKVGQIWAVYDTVDAMPRFYARISKVFSSGFEVRITWLEPHPVHEDEIEWVNKDLPFSCGNFKLGYSEDTKDCHMFSHVMTWGKGSGRRTFKICPKKGETWALFRDWDIKWDSCSNSKRKYEFDFVEVLSDYDGVVGVCVAYLGKLKSFTSVFVRKLENELQIPPRELLRFSHRVPSFKLTGVEEETVPRGSLELDPAAILMDLEEISLPKEIKVETKETLSNGSSFRSSGSNVKEFVGREPTLKVQKSTRLDNFIDENAIDSSSFSEEFELPVAEFFNFDVMRSLDKFCAGQVWALYSDEDGLPKCYALIKNINLHPDHKLTIQYLEAYSLSSDSLPNKKIPICCGRFGIKIGKLGHYVDSSSFSHQVQAERLNKKNTFTIYPRAGEIWALYKNWNPDMTSPDLEKCDYDIVEVRENNASHVKVLFLERVLGFNVVFKPREDGKSLATFGIPSELRRFSHQVPLFRLKEERGGSLNGFFELDPAALPHHTFHPN
ncbi:hypothetical protein Dimus_029246 [Dionaea muscipula]